MAREDAELRLETLLSLNTQQAMAQVRQLTAQIQAEMAKTGWRGGVGGFLQSGQGNSAALADQARSLGYLKQTQQQANAAAEAVGNIGRQGKWTVRVLEAFTLYRGFVALQTGAEAVVRNMVDLNHQVSLILTQLPNFGRGMREAVTGQILQVSRDTGKSFQDVAQAMYQITSAGYDGAQAFRALEVTAKAATAGGTDATNAFNAAQAQIGAFGLSIDQLGEVYDEQFQLVRRGIFSYEQLTTVVGVTAEAFADAGQSIETANAALATVSLVFTGPQLQRGATGLRALAEALTSREENFNALGVGVRNASGEMRDLIPILEDLDGALAGMTSAEKARAMRDIFPDVREQRSVGALLTNMQELRRNYAEQVLAVGSLDKAYKVFDEDTRTLTDRVKQSIQVGFTPLERSLNAAAQGLSRIDDALPGFIGSMLTATTAVTGLALAYAYLNAQTGRAAFAGPAFGPGGATSLPMSRGAGIAEFMRGRGFRTGAGAVGAYALGSAASTRMDGVGGFLGSVGAGAGFGLIGGPQGAVIGAAVGGITYAIQEGFSKDKLGEAGMSMAEAFAKELKNNSQSIGEAFSKALRHAQRDIPPPDAAVMGRIQAGMYISSFAPPASGGERRNFRSEDDARAAGYRPVRRVGRAVEAVRLSPVYGNAEGGAVGAYEAGVAAREETRRQPQYAFLDPDEQAALLAQAFADAIRDALPDDPGLAGVVLGISQRADGVDQFREGFKALQQGQDVFAKWLTDAGDSVGEFVQEAEEAFDRFAFSMERNSIEAREIEMRAKLQGRELTAEERNQILHLEAANLRLERQKLEMEALDEAMKGLTQATTQAAQATTEMANAIRTLPAGLVGPPSAGWATAPESEWGPVPTGPGIVGPPLPGGKSANYNAYPTYKPLTFVSDPGPRQAGLPGLYASHLAGDNPGNLSNATRLGGLHNLILGRSGLDANRLGDQTLYGDLLRLTMANAIGGGRGVIGMHGQLSLEGTRFRDDIMPGGFGRGSENNRLMMTQFFRVLKSALESQKRGGDIVFNGPTVPSELDLYIRQLQRLGPVAVRNRSRVR